MSEPMTLDEIGRLLVKAIRKLTPTERRKLAAALLRDLKTEVGGLRKS